MKHRRNIFVFTIVPVWALLLSLTFYLNKSSLSAAPATFTVTTTNDSGAGSLRQAIEDANNNGNPSDMDIIEFDIPGSQVHTINLQSDLPSVTEKLTIDGYTQEGAQENTAISPNPINSVIKIEIDFSNVVKAEGIDEALKITAEESIVRGLAIFSDSVQNPRSLINFTANNCVFIGNYGNVRADGLTRVDIDSDSINFGQEGPAQIVRFDGATGGRIGGTDPADRNVFGLQTGSSIGGSVSVVSNNIIVKGNYIGIAKDGITDIGGSTLVTDNTRGSGGLDLSGSGITVGGVDAADRNVLSGATIFGITINGNNNIIQGNYFGADYTGQANDAINTGTGIIVLANSEGNLIGGTGQGEGNIVAGTSGTGIGIFKTLVPDFEVTQIPNNNAILGNSISKIRKFSIPQFGVSNQGIDMLVQELQFTESGVNATVTNQGPTPNDVGDGDTGPNGYINFPVLKTAQQVGNQLTITYDLDATDSPSDRYRVEFYANNERSIFGYGPGETYLGAATSVEPGNNKTATITVNGDFTGKALSATTTAIDDTTDSGFGSTSEFAQNISIGSVEDFDADGIPSSVEDAAPNNGDGNNDGIPDKDQPTVSSYPDYDNSNYLTLITDGCSENGTVSSLGPNALQTQDSGYSYPHGLTNFTLYCSRGDTVNLTMYIHGDTTTPEQYIPRKYNPTTNQFSDVPGSNVTTETLGASTATKLTYAATDGGDLDDDGEENGIIVDPVGLATEQNGVLANTGDLIILAIPIGLSLLLGAFIVTYIDYRKHKKPLQEADQELAKTYTYWHHLKTVTIPLFSYRLSFGFERRERAHLTPGNVS